MARSKEIVAVCITVLFYVIHLIFSGLAAEGSSKLFPHNTSTVAKHFQLEITPANSTFSIWGVILAYQVMWMVYVVASLFRSGPETNILTTKFYVAFNINIIFVTVWLFMWAIESAIGCFIVIVMAQVFLDITLYIAITDFHDYTSTHDVCSMNKVDVWCHRLLIQNGILFYGTWTTIASLINTAIVFAYELGVSTQTASIVALCLLTIIVIIWFVLENFAFCGYTDYTFTAYIVLIWGLTGIHCHVWGKNEPVAIFNLVLLIFSCLFLVARIVIIVLKCKRKSSYETIGYDAKQGAVKT